MQVVFALFFTDTTSTQGLVRVGGGGGGVLYSQVPQTLFPADSGSYPAKTTLY